MRSAWDALLRSLELPPGSHVLMTAINIPDMRAIVEMHNLVPVPVDISVHTLTITDKRLAVRRC